MRQLTFVRPSGIGLLPSLRGSQDLPKLQQASYRKRQLLRDLSTLRAEAHLDLQQLQYSQLSWVLLEVLPPA